MLASCLPVGPASDTTLTRDPLAHFRRSMARMFRCFRVGSAVKALSIELIGSLCALNCFGIHFGKFSVLAHLLEDNHVINFKHVIKYQVTNQELSNQGTEKLFSFIF